MRRKVFDSCKSQVIKTIAYEFVNGHWVPRWKLINHAWIDLRYPQYNKTISGRFIEVSYVFEPAEIERE
jgi:hypothetical protein